jgi:hypothetical protein
LRAGASRKAHQLDFLEEAIMLRFIIVLGCIAAFTPSALAEVVEFVVDPALTRWDLDGSYFRGGIEQGEFEAQTQGSHITSLTGVLRVNLTPTTIQFLPGSVLDAVPQPVIQRPGPNGGPGVFEADFGVESPTLGPPAPVFAVRDFGFSLESEPIELRGMQFNEDLTAFLNARIDYDLGATSGAYSLSNWQRGFDDDHVGTLRTEGNVQTLRLQNYLGDIFMLQSPADSSFVWSGPIVATRIIPEPSGWLLVVLALWSGAVSRRIVRAAAGRER